MKCPGRGAAELIQDTRDLRTTYKGEQTIIPAEGAFALCAMSPSPTWPEPNLSCAR